MRCIRANCSDEAERNSVYCSPHRPKNFTVPRVGPVGGASYEISGEEDPDAHYPSCCSVDIGAFVRHAGMLSWDPVRDYGCIVEGDELEIVVRTGCRALIDISPDRYQPTRLVLWHETTFIPSASIPSRYKVAYYAPKVIREPGEVTFRVRVRCFCGNRVKRERSSFVLVFLHPDESPFASYYTG